MTGNAEIVGVEEQLTVPSRHHPQFVDIWMAITWSASCPEWTPAFEALANRRHLELLPSGSLQVMALSERQGWIVARAVGSDQRRRADVENLLRRLVDQANRHIETPCAEVTPGPARGARAGRIRMKLAILSAVTLGFFLSRRTSDPDVASSS